MISIIKDLNTNKVKGVEIKIKTYSLRIGYFNFPWVFVRSGFTYWDAIRYDFKSWLFYSCKRENREYTFVHIRVLFLGIALGKRKEQP